MLLLFLPPPQHHLCPPECNDDPSVPACVTFAAVSTGINHQTVRISRAAVALVAAAAAAAPTMMAVLVVALLGFT